jgi:hypothetical protein
MAQLLVVKRAIRAVENHQAAQAAQALRPMRERFMTFERPTPFSWVLRLLTYGKEIRVATSRPGHIDWSDNRQTVSYEERRLSMGEFREFIRKQPGCGVPGQQWLLERVLLRDGFLEVRTVDQKPQAIWHAGKIDQYLSRVEGFLRRLPLLVHIIGGQLARAPELLTLRHSNTMSGGLRSIFIEQGLVSTVTTYHKGYAATRTPKVIHRYLPPAASKLVVYCLWLVLPFRVVLERHKGRPASPFLWPGKNGLWKPDRLRQVLLEESRDNLHHIRLKISNYRHVVVAIAREQ